MKLYIRQKVFTLRDKFTVKDETGGDRYFVEGAFLSIGKRLRITDLSGNEIALIRQNLLSFLPNFRVFIDSRLIADITSRFSIIRPKYSIRGLGWEVRGSILEHDYEITQNGATIASIHKHWMSWGDCYELDIANERDEIIALAVVLAIDCVLDNKD